MSLKSKEHCILWAEQQRIHKRFKRDHIDATSAAINDITYNYNNNIFFNDPFWSQQWNLKNSRTTNGQPISMHVMKAWELGYTGKGVVVTILVQNLIYKKFCESFLEHITAMMAYRHNHTDIVRNYDPQSSYDLNDNDPDPILNFPFKYFFCISKINL
ncbi:unnamed protein product [Cercopithifilaria johnstoni]|uniref:Uncharacterized protein n=1 Tax=Cercopithifilaria johnstoni TaxID=2874296 RepID=A0A8J2LWG0_9BILA|nr:unnamed protein product [Cercopithifilaria johnstoni]